MKARTNIEKWVKEGCDLKQALQLLSKYSPNDHFIRLCYLQPERNRAMITYQLLQLAGISNAQFYLLQAEGTPMEPAKADPIKKETKINPQVKLREDFPFLKDNDCPHELQILVSFKISAYHNYIAAHKKLFDCESLEACLLVSQSLVSDFIENRLIFRELNHYKEHGSCLGKHPIFKQRKKFLDLQGMDIRKLYRLHDQTIPHRIWRIQSELRREDKPKLQKQRQERLKEYKAQLAEIKRILAL